MSSKVDPSEWLMNAAVAGSKATPGAKSLATSLAKEKRAPDKSVPERRPKVRPVIRSKPGSAAAAPVVNVPVTPGPKLKSKTAACAEAPPKTARQETAAAQIAVLGG